MNFKLIFAAAALLATQSFAIAGIGAHYTPNVGTKLRSADRADFKTENVNLEGKLGFSHGNFSYIQGFGFKAWVDILPFVDIEATFNIQFASYNAALWTYDDGEPVKHPLEMCRINQEISRYMLQEMISEVHRHERRPLRHQAVLHSIVPDPSVCRWRPHLPLEHVRLEQGFCREYHRRHVRRSQG